MIVKENESDFVRKNWVKVETSKLNEVFEYFTFARDIINQQPTSTFNRYKYIQCTEFGNNV